MGFQPFAIHPKIKKITHDLQSMLGETNPTRKEEFACYIRARLLEIGEDESFEVFNQNRLSNLVSNLLMCLNHDYPLNEEDPISLENITELSDAEVVCLNSGHRFHVPSLVEFFNRNHRNMSTFINPVTMTRIPFEDGLKIAIKAEHLKLSFKEDVPNSNLINQTLLMKKLVLIYQEMSLERQAKLVESFMNIVKIFKSIQSSLNGMAFCYLFSMCTEHYLSLLDHTSPAQLQELHDNNASNLLLFNILPSLFVLRTFIALKKDPVAEIVSDASQLRYFFIVFLTYLFSHYVLSNVTIDHQSDDYLQAKFISRYLFLWMVMAQLIYPRSSFELNTYYENLLSGGISALLEINRYSQFDSQKCYEDISSTLFLNVWFILPKLRGIYVMGRLTYDEVLQPNSSFHRSFTQLKKIFDDAREVVHQHHDAPNRNHF